MVSKDDSTSTSLPILIITHKSDYTADYIINKLNERNIQYKRLNCEDILETHYTLSFNPEFKFTLLAESQYRSIWYRRTKLPEIEGLNNAERLYVLGETDVFIRNLFLTLPSKWLSVPECVEKAENKFLQLQIANEIGFKIPNTIVTNSSHDIKQFYNENNRSIIIKPISQKRIQYNNSDGAMIFTNEVPGLLIEKLESYDLTPTIFQEKLNKEYELRITVVGDKVFPAAVYSQDDKDTLVDWRKKKLKFYEITIPKDIESKCLKLLNKFGLSFGAIVGFPEFRPFKIRNQQAVRRVRISTKNTNFKTEYDDEIKIYRGTNC
jgi:hypothetical protein